MPDPRCAIRSDRARQRWRTGALSPIRLTELSQCPWRSGPVSLIGSPCLCPAWVNDGTIGVLEKCLGMVTSLPSESARRGLTKALVRLDAFPDAPRWVLSQDHAGPQGWTDTQWLPATPLQHVHNPVEVDRHLDTDGVAPWVARSLGVTRVWLELILHSEQPLWWVHCASTEEHRPHR